MTSITRRRALSGILAVCGAPVVVPSSVLGAGAPSNRINIGCIGVGRMGMGDLDDVIAFSDVRVVAVCDVDKNRLEAARRHVEEYYARRNMPGGCAAYVDYRELLARADVDAVQIVTPDHWHALPAIAAARAGKDLFVQKPLTYTVEEGRILADTVRRYGRILQTGSQQRSEAFFRQACELVRNGRIGRLHTVKVGLPTDPGGKLYPPEPVPPELDYEFWLGPAPYAPYTEQRVHPRRGYGRPGWLRISDYCIGMINAWGSHHHDIAQWAMGTELTGPVEITGTAEFPRDGLWDVHGSFTVEYTYASGVKLISADTRKNRPGVTFEGTDGWIWVDRGRLDAQPRSILQEKIGPNEIHLYQSRHHKGNWLECIRTRREPIAPAEVGHRSCTLGVLGYIAMKLGRKLRWDPDRERFIGDSEADRMLSRPMRQPWYA